MAPSTREAVLETYRKQYGDGAYAYAKRTIASWEHRQVEQVGQCVMRLLEVVPLFVDLQTKFELAQILRHETLSRIRQVRMHIRVTSDRDLNVAIDQVKAILDAQLSTKLPPGVIEARAWLSKEDAGFFEQMIQEGEKRVLYAQSEDFFRRFSQLRSIVLAAKIPLRMKAVYELPTARITFSIVQTKRTGMNEESLANDDSGLLARWNDLELETRFKSGEVSYPEYVLRNMEKIFTKEEQSELQKIAAMHGLELERMLMEIQIKSKTSEADLQKLLTTLRTLQEKRITADIVSRHETPSGHIEISARSRRSIGCLPVGGLAILALAFLCH
jgi:hypothetical protein